MVLAAGAGRRMGGPKALVRDPDDVPWAVRSSRLLAEAGCSPVLVVIGAAADEVRAVLTAEPVQVVEATDWEEGMSASLRAGLKALPQDVDGVVVVPVDVPGLTAAAVRRVAGDGSGLARAVYDGRPGHPVLLGRDHWEGVIATARGDAGARDYLKQHRAAKIDCADVAEGADVDSVEQLPDGHRAG